jgi:ParB family chromosome partitioning protein
MTSKNLNAAASAAVSKFFTASPLIEASETSKQEIIDLPLAEIADYHNHTFKVLRAPQNEWNALIDSIRQYGVQQPILVRRTPGQDKPYECISGHRRRLASKDAGMATIPARIVDLDDDEADLLMVATNTCQRTTWLPSEKAKSWKTEYEAIRHQGVKDNEADKLIEQLTGQSLRTVQRYIRLNRLSEPLLDKLDEGKLSFSAAYLAASLNTSGQEVVQRLLQNGVKVTTKLVELIANHPEMSFDEVLSAAESGQNTRPAFSIGKRAADRLNACFPEDFTGSSQDKINLIERLLKKHFDR